jgi:hypothetical protein
MKNQPDPLFNLQELQTISAGDSSFLDSMIQLYISQIEGFLLDISHFTLLKDYAKIKTIVHKMKPSVIVMGATSTSEIILRIEEMDLERLDEPLFSELLLKLKDNLQKINDLLRSL